MVLITFQQDLDEDVCPTIVLKKEKYKMLTMNKFYNMLAASSEDLPRYLKVLRTLTKVSRTQLVAMASDLGWQAW